MIDQQRIKEPFSRGTKCLRPYKFLFSGIMMVLGFTMGACAQNLELIKKSNDHHKVYKWNKGQNKTNTLFFNDSCTSVFFEVEGNQTFKGVFVIEGIDTIPVKEALHVDSDKDTKRSEPVIFKDRTNKFKLIEGTLEGTIKIHLLDAGGNSIKNHELNKRINGKCDRPTTVPQSQWRQGLPDPNNQPINHKVNHCIVHHSAGSNNNPDTREVVRNIYLFHTNNNGWDDIGYNFLIGINGDIYEGRDGKGMVHDSDVKGAHFCGKNSNTMGIGIIGTYTDTVPSDSALRSLKSILSWKLFKERLNPLGNQMHPQNSNDQDLLGIISGHRDGCATKCPGNALYAQLPMIKQDVADSVSDCRIAVGKEKVLKQAGVNLSYDNGHIIFKDYNLEGKGEILIFNSKGQQIDLAKAVDFNGPSNKKVKKSLPSGVYIAKIMLDQGKAFSKRFFVGK